MVRRRLALGFLAFGLSLVPVATTAARVHAQVTDAEGSDGGDVSGGDGGAGAAGTLPTGSQNNAAPGDEACFADEGCVAFEGDPDWWATDAFADDAFADVEAFDEE